MFTKATQPNTVNYLATIREKPFVLPNVEQNETVVEYVTAVRQESPVEYFTLGGVNFEKHVLPSEFSLRQNIGKTYLPNYLVKLLTEKQANAILEEAKKRELIIPTRRNPKFDADPKELEFLPKIVVKLSDYMILVQKDKFNPMDFEVDEKEKATGTPNLLLVDQSKEDIYNVQKAPSKGVKK